MEIHVTGRRKDRHTPDTPGGGHGKLLVGSIISSPFSRVDFNRAGVPLIEIVTEPDIRSPEEARLFLQKLRSILQYIAVSDCKMEEGSMRCDANISIRPVGSREFGTKTELKNMNSFRAVYRGIEYEVERQRSVVLEGGKVIPETRHWDEEEGVTKAMRSKFVSADYRCFPDPNIPPFKPSPEWLEKIRSSIPELPDARYARFINEYGLPPYDAEILTASRELADFYDAVLAGYNAPKAVSNWIMSELLRLLNSTNTGIEDCKIKPEDLGKLLQMIDNGTISGKIAKGVFEEMLPREKSRKNIEKKGLTQISDEDELSALLTPLLPATPVGGGLP